CDVKDITRYYTVRSVGVRWETWHRTTLQDAPHSAGPCMAVARLVSQYLTARWRCEQVPIISSVVLGSFGSSRSSICRHAQDKSLSDRALSYTDLCQCAPQESPRPDLRDAG